MAQRTKGKPRIGRPPRRDRPVRLTVLVPSALRRWLEVQAGHEGRSQGHLVTSALVHYQHRARRKP